MRTDRLKIVQVGGGSVSWTPRIGADLLLTPALATPGAVATNRRGRRACPFLRRSYIAPGAGIHPG